MLQGIGWEADSASWHVIGTVDWSSSVCGVRLFSVTSNSYDDACQGHQFEREIQNVSVLLGPARIIKLRMLPTGQQNKRKRSIQQACLYFNRGTMMSCPELTKFSTSCTATFNPFYPNSKKTSSYFSSTTESLLLYFNDWFVMAGACSIAVILTMIPRKYGLPVDTNGWLRAEAVEAQYETTWQLSYKKY